MSLIRTGHKPTDWRDEGPSTARLSGNGGSIVVGESARTVAERSRREWQAKQLRGEALLERPRSRKP